MKRMTIALLLSLLVAHPGRRRRPRPGRAARGRRHQGRHDRRAAVARPPLDHRGHRPADHLAHLRDALHLRQEPHPDSLARGRPHRRRRRPPLHHHAPQGRQVPQRQGDDLRRRGALAPALGEDVHHRQAPLEDRGGGGGEGPLHRRHPPEGAFGVAALRPRAGPTTAPPSIPKEVIAAAGDGQIKEFIGTGPYRFVEHKPDRHIKVARFKEYSARADASDGGYGGKRTAYADEILFIPVPDEAVRLAGVETGEYHYAQSIKADQYERVKGTPALEPGVVKPFGWITAVPNHKQGVMANKKVRQAFLAALDMDPDHGGGHRQQGLLPDRRRALLSRADRLPLARAASPATTRRTPPRRAPPQGGRLQGRARSLDHHQGIRLDVQHLAGGQATDGGGGLHGRSPGARLGHPRPAAQQAGAIRHLLDRLHA